ncbi:hypothetical protein GS429_17545 [Natronorubrum sp. JWXQ-INN-674]|uniref:Uncharacterized protein n=1 Tax=Natronorubrum halalkaliphilum TaxID=2691917 RepID=A0A6B0VRR9_9EURY|nr:hypothetical protein [Natronorubrum halalkaliphilum]MXV63833.1 hypothetical protein [Natronorubrum halalkaliphilum]
MTDSDAEPDETRETDRMDQLRSVYLSVTDGDGEPVVESQQEESPSREIRETYDAEALGPAEHHGLDDAIDDPGPAG